MGIGYSRWCVPGTLHVAGTKEIDILVSRAPSFMFRAERMGDTILNYLSVCH